MDHLEGAEALDDVPERDAGHAYLTAPAAMPAMK